MRYVLAILLPPVAVLMCGKPMQALLNLILWIAGGIPGMIHALFVVHNYHADERHEELMKVTKSSAKG